MSRDITRERATGIEPAFSSWEADVLPLNYARENPANLHAGQMSTSAGQADPAPEDGPLGLGTQGFGKPGLGHPTGVSRAGPRGSGPNYAQVGPPHYPLGRIEIPG